MAFVRDYFMVNTSNPVVGWYNSSEASLTETLRTNFFINGYEESFNVVVEVVSSGFEVARTTIVVETQGLRFDPDDTWCFPNEMINVMLVTTHTIDLFYVRIVNETGSSTVFNWTSEMTTPDGHWQTSFVVPDSWPSGGYMMEVRSQFDSSLWNNRVFNVSNGPPTTDAGPDQSVTAGDTVFFNESGSSDDGTVVNWTWTFEYGGDVVELYGVSPSFQFDDVDTYSVTLNVTDAAGNNASDTMAVTVEAVIPELGTSLALGMSTVAIIGAVIAASEKKRRRLAVPSSTVLMRGSLVLEPTPSRCILPLPS
jgi:hypothetical protein